MDNPTGDLPQLPPNLRDKLDQLRNLLDGLRLDLAGVRMDPVDDTRLPSLKKPILQDNIAEIIDALNRLNDPLVRRSGLKIEGVEMTQSVQFYNLHGQGSGKESDNMVPLVAGKDLILRVYVERRAGSFFAAPDRFSGVVSYRGKQVNSLNGPLDLKDPDELRRSRINDSLNFRVPAADCHGSVTFNVRVYEWRPSSRYTIPGLLDNYHSATYRVTADFHEIPRMKLTGVLIRFTGNNQNLAAPTGTELVATAARVLPMLPTPGFDYNACTVIDFDQDVTVRANWDNLLNLISNLRSASTTRTYFVGLLPAGVATLPSIAARGIGNTGVAVASRDDTRALGHEFGHTCVLQHIDFNAPPPPHDTKYPDYNPFPFGSVGEVGLDTARMTTYGPAWSYDFMTYSENGQPPPLFPTSTWISPYNYKKMMYAIRSTEGTGDLPIIASIISATVVLFNFRVHRGGRVDVSPSYPVRGLPRVLDNRPTADIMLDVLDRNGEVIYSHRCHQHNPYQDPDGAYLDFHEPLPWSEDVGEVVVVRGREELSRLRAGGPTREVRVEGVRRLEQEGQGELARVDWSVAGGDPQEGEAGKTAALVRYTNDGGRTWQAVAADLGDPRHTVNLDLLPGGEDCRFQLIVSSGLSATVAESEPFQVKRKPRRAHIVSPQNGQTFRAGEPVVFAGAGHSPDFGTSPDDEVTWTSSLECCGLGSGTYLVRDDLPPGTHRVTLVTGDGQGGEVTAGVWIKVEAAPDHGECRERRRGAD